ncbi:MAG: phage integrase N-terminal SAM-like domain-containing protein [Metallibacterium scheffleri]
MSYLPGTEGVSVATEGTPAPRLLDEARRRLRLKHYSLCTEQAYIGWIRRFILGNGKRHPREMGAAEVERFLSDLAVARSGGGENAEPGAGGAVVSVSRGAGAAITVDG